MPSRARRYPRSDARWNQIVITVRIGITVITVSRASFSSRENISAMIVTIEMSWIPNELMPSWRNCWRFSMSLVIRLMSTPAFSSVKKSRLRRCRCVNTKIRSRCMTRAASRPEASTNARCA
jgi:hypothetical protein